VLRLLGLPADEAAGITCVPMTTEDNDDTLPERIVDELMLPLLT